MEETVEAARGLFVVVDVLVLVFIFVFVVHRGQLGSDVLLHDFGDLGRDAAAVEEVVDRDGARVVVLLEVALDLLVRDVGGEGNEADLAGGGVDAAESAVVERVDDGLHVLDVADVDPDAALASACVARDAGSRSGSDVVVVVGMTLEGGRAVGEGVGLDVVGRGGKGGAQVLEDGVGHGGGAFAAQLADEDAEGGPVARAVADLALGSGRLGIAVEAAPDADVSWGFDHDGAR